jgi:two-component system, response regulator YesN
MPDNHIPAALHAFESKTLSTNEQIVYAIMEKIILAMDEKLLISDFSQDYKMQPDKLRKLFKNKSGFSFTSFQMEVRFQRARQLLEVPAVTIRSIALEVGYPNPANFSRLFKQKMGVPPRIYRKNHGPMSAK